MKRWTAGLITVLAFAGALWFSRPGDRAGKTTVADTPEARVARMFAAAERGDGAAYLDCFTGDERRRLERELADQTLEAWGLSLRRAVQELTGRAVFHATPGAPAGTEVQLTVERVYVHRTERQLYRLVWENNDWRIAGVQAAQPYQPASAYGTPVFEEVPAAANTDLPPVTPAP